ncbi:MAG: hypothetical protein ACTSUK_11700, partial [Promethearchaeota archaeon]
TMSAGIAIAHSNFPVYYLYNLVDQLLKNAKKKAKSNGNVQTVIDFMVFKSQGGEITEINNYRNDVLKKTIEGYKDQNLILTYRPYLLCEFSELLDYVEKMKQVNFSKSKLYSLRSALNTSRENSILYYLYQVSRSNKTEKKLLQSDFNNHFNIQCPPWQAQATPSSARYEEFKTPLPDIIEIFDFI